MSGGLPRDGLIRLSRRLPVIFGDRPASALRRRWRRPAVERLEDRTALSPLYPGPTRLQATEGHLYDGPIGTFTDANLTDTPANFTATIDWGDGSATSPGTVTGANGQFTVSGQHTYIEEGNYPLRATVTQDNGATITLGGPPQWTPLVATLPPALSDQSAPVTGRNRMAAATGADGKVYVFGGRYETTTGGGGGLDRVDAYDPATRAWALVSSLPGGARWDLSGTAGLDGKIYVLGGQDGGPNPVKRADAYDPATQTWTQLPDLPSTRLFAFGMGATTGTDGKIYAISGFFETEVDAYDPANPAQGWQRKAPLPTQRRYLGAATGRDGTIYAIGGLLMSGLPTDEVNAYNPATNTWSALPPLLTPRYAPAATTGHDGRIYVIGGVGPINGANTDEVEVFDPATQTWTVMGAHLPSSRDSLAATTGADGTIYALGGSLSRGLTNEVDTFLPPGTGANTATVADAPLNASGTSLHRSLLALVSETVATFTDPGGPEPLGEYAAAIDWGDQSSPTVGVIRYDADTGQFSVQGSHTFADYGTYTVRITVEHGTAPPAQVNISVELTPLATASLSGTVFRDFNNDGQVDFGEQGIGGVAIALTGTDDLGRAVNLSQTTDEDGAYVFANLRPGDYYLTETTQPTGTTSGKNSVGTAGGQLSGPDQFFVALAQGVNGLNYNFGERPAAGGGVSQGQTSGIGFWNNRNGQALIRSFNGGTGHRLGDWLAATFVNLYGAGSANNLAGKDNGYIADLFQQNFVMKGPKLDAQVLATALSVYATNATLDDTRAAAQYGFRVEGDGLGTATFSVGTNGAAFGVVDDTTMTVLDLLLAADAQAVNGVLYGGDAALRNKANNVFGAINQAGSTG